MQFCYYLPLTRSMAFHMHKIDFPSPKNVLCEVGLKFLAYMWLGWRFWIFTILLLNLPLSLEKNVALYLFKLEFHLPKNALNQVSSSSIENVENVKSWHSWYVIVHVLYVHILLQYCQLEIIHKWILVNTFIIVKFQTKKHNKQQMLSGIYFHL